MTIDEIKERFKKAYQAFTEATRKFKDIKLQDGTVLRIDGEEPAQGAPVFVIDENGETPAPNGEHIMEDGSMIVVADGVIAEVKPKEEEEMNDDEKFDAEASYKSLAETIAPLIEKVDALEKALSAKDEAMQAQKAEFGKNQKELFEIVEKILNMPAADPTDKKKNQFNKSDSVAERLRKAKEEVLAFRKSLKEYKD